MNPRLLLTMKKCVRTILRVFRIFPVKNNRVVFISYEGQRYSCNPKYVSEYLEKAYPSRWEIIWVLDHPGKYPQLQQRGIRMVKNDSLAFVKAVATAKAIVSNNGLALYLPSLRESQCFINTWHGGGAYKRVLNDWKKEPIEREINTMIAAQTTYFLSGCHRFTEVMAEAASMPLDKMREWGMPRNDVLFEEHPEVVRRVKEAFGLPENCRIVLYAPTYRGGTTTSVSAMEQNTPLDATRCLESLRQRFDGEWFFLYRDHYFNQEQQRHPRENVLDASTYDDMQELLCAADVLITDYSSSIWDYSFTGKPCLLYAPDRKNYQSERDFYTPIEEWPFPLAEDNDQLMEKICSFDPEEYDRAVRQHHDQLGSCETGHAAQTVGDYLYRFCLEGAKK